MELEFCMLFSVIMNPTWKKKINLFPLIISKWRQFELNLNISKSFDKIFRKVKIFYTVAQRRTK